MPPKLPPREPPPNVLILLLDDIGPSALDAYDEEGPVLARTPNIDALADQGMRFDRAYALPVCSPTRAALMTGRQAVRHGIGNWLDIREDNWELPLWEVTLPEMLEQAPDRWDTSVTGKWHLTTAGASGSDHAALQGWDWWSGAIGNPRMHITPAPAGEDLGYELWEKHSPDGIHYSRTYMTTDSADDAVARIGEMEPPWLLYVPFNAPHTPLQPPPEDLLAEPLPVPYTDLQVYEAMVEALDTELGRILDAAPENTLIVVMGDNGPAFEGKGSVSEAGMRVPLIVAGPGVAPGTSTDALAHVVDLFPTLAEIAGVKRVVDPLGDPVELDGVSLVPIFEDPQASVRDTIVGTFFYPSGPPPYKHRQVSVRDDRYKLVFVQGQWGFYDLKNRLEEGRNLLDGPLDDRQQEAYEALEKELLRRSRQSFAYPTDADVRHIFAHLAEQSIAHCVDDDVDVELWVQARRTGQLILEAAWPETLGTEARACLAERLHAQAVPLLPEGRLLTHSR